jgi:hypothetical protein
MTFYELPLNLQLAHLCALVSLISLGYIVWAGDYGIRDLLTERRLRRFPRRGATRV